MLILLAHGSLTARADTLRWYPVTEPAIMAAPAPSAPPASSNALLPARARAWRPMITEVAQRYALDPRLLTAVIHHESAFRVDAVSAKGAIGLMQLMPATASRFGQLATTEPRANLAAGAAYLRWLLTRFDGRLDLALAGYNAGEGAVIRYHYQIPPYPETISYVHRILEEYAGQQPGDRVPSTPHRPVRSAPVSAPPLHGDMTHLLQLLTSGPRALPVRTAREGKAP